MVEEILNSYRLLIADARRMVSDIPDSQMSAQPLGLNPPAWILGHLVYSAQQIGGELGLAPWLPQPWIHAFRTGSRPAEQSTYPPKSELLAALDDAFERISRQVRTIAEAGLLQPLPDERWRTSFPTLAHAIVHILAAHTSLHLGQLSAWRRASGLTTTHI